VTGSKMNLNDFEMLSAQHVIMPGVRYFSVTTNDASYDAVIDVLRDLEEQLHERGLSFEELESTQIIISDMEKWSEVGRAFNEFCAGKQPVMTSVEEKKTSSSDFQVEIRANALLQ